jgi:ADP-ribosylglycohydrolase
VKEHVGLTHAHANVLRAADTLVRVLWGVSLGESVHDVLRREAGDWISGKKADSWLHQADEHVVGSRFSPACYIADAMPASLYLVWKYQSDFTAGIVANAMVGGDNCHRGAVVGSILGAANGVPERFLLGNSPGNSLGKHASRTPSQ